VKKRGDPSGECPQDDSEGEKRIIKKPLSFYLKGLELIILTMCHSYEVVTETHSPEILP